MLKKFAVWFTCFGLSFLVSDVFGWTEQGRAFLVIDLGLGILVTLLIMATGSAKREYGVTSLAVLITAGRLAINLLATWGATKLFDVDFFVAYQIMTFGICLCADSKKKDD